MQFLFLVGSSDDSASENLQCAPRHRRSLGKRSNGLRPTWAAEEQEIKAAESDRRTRDHRRMIRRGMPYLSPRSKAVFGTVEIAKEQLHGGFGASELTPTRKEALVNSIHCVGFHSAMWAANDLNEEECRLVETKIRHHGQCDRAIYSPPEGEQDTASESRSNVLTYCLQAPME
ncbi:hypothetical protein TNCV_5136411 [Trichonephila clavipes]|nr:hypothetical protein TNCV_5136411 [Trichonephila clavipes]